MLPIKGILRQFLLGRVLVSLIVYTLPFLLLIGLGFLWLSENGWALPFVLITCTLIAVYRLGLMLFLRWKKRTRALAPEVRQEETGPLVAANPDWSAAERQVFAELSASIRQKLADPLPWPGLQPAAIDVARQAAKRISGGTRDVLDVSVPETLLLASRVVSQLRGDIRRYVPLAESVNLSTLLWFYQNRQWIGLGQKAMEMGKLAYRLFANVPAAVVQSVQQVLLQETGGHLKGTVETTLQRLILEEVAKASIDLFGGYLRFSDSELLEITLASQAHDLAFQAQEDLPLRVVVVGQVSAGKTSLINALSGEHRGETDMMPTTPALGSHRLEVAGGAFIFADTQGIDGSEVVNAQLLAQLMEADLVLWAVRANRPARAPDLALLQRLRAELAANPARRAPRIIMAVTNIDTLIPGWPLPENWMGPAEQAKVAAVLRSISEDLGEDLLIPVVAAEPDWNIGLLEKQISAEAAEALMVQRNRRRLTGTANSGGLVNEAQKVRRSVMKAGEIMWKGFRG